MSIKTTRLELNGIENSKNNLGRQIKHDGLMRESPRKPGPILIRNGKSKAWFYPSTGLNELFRRVAKPKIPDTKITHYNPKPSKRPYSSAPTQPPRATHVEIVRKMDVGEEQKGSGAQDAGHGSSAGRGNPACGGAGASKGTLSGGFNADSHGQGQMNQYGSFNHVHGRGRAYGGYARGWQRPPYRGRFAPEMQHHGNYARGGGRAVAHANANPANAQAGGGVHVNVNTGGVHVATGQTLGMAGGGVELPAPLVSNVFMEQKAGKAKVDEGGAAGANVKDTKKFCFRCYKPGHGKLECIAKLLCEICGNTDKCPILKQPRTLAHPCGHDVSGLGFYHIPHAPYTTTKSENRTALVTVEGGTLTMEQLVAELG
jgi:hypothetical protein